MDDDALKAKIREVIEEYVITGEKKDFTLESLAMVQPGLADVMPDVGARTWKLYYAAKGGAWDLAKFQWKEINGLFDKGAFLRAKHANELYQYMEEDWKQLEAPIKAQDFEKFDEVFRHCISQANAYHELKDKPYIVWKLPDTPPPDLDFSPRG
jgi:hypothetical protein